MGNMPWWAGAGARGSDWLLPVNWRHWELRWRRGRTDPEGPCPPAGHGRPATRLPGAGITTTRNPSGKPSVADWSSRPITSWSTIPGGSPGGPGSAWPGWREFEVAFRRHLVVNHLLAQLLLAQDAGRRVRADRQRDLHSVEATVTGMGVSNTVQAAVANWAKTLAAEVALPGITVNNVPPGRHARNAWSRSLSKTAKSGLTEAETISAWRRRSPGALLPVGGSSWARAGLPILTGGILYHRHQPAGGWRADGVPVDRSIVLSCGDGRSSLADQVIAVLGGTMSMISVPSSP